MRKALTVSVLVVLIAAVAWRLAPQATEVVQQWRLQRPQKAAKPLQPQLRSAELAIEQHRYASAIETLNALQPVIESEAPHSDLLARDLRLLGSAELAQGHDAEAESAWLRALEPAKAYAPQDPAEMIFICGLLSLHYEAIGRSSQAVQYIKMAISGYERDAANNQVAIARALGHLGDAEANRQDAARHYERAVSLYRAANWQDVADVAGTLGDLAGVQFFLGEYADSRRNAAEALKMDEARYGKDSSYLGRPLGVLARLDNNRSRAAEGEREAKRALAIFERSAGRDRNVDEPGEHWAPQERDEAVVSAANDLAEVYITEGKIMQAIGLYERLVREFGARLGQNDPSLALLLGSEGDFYRDFSHGHDADAERCYKQAIEIYGNQGDKGIYALASTRSSLALLYDYGRRFVEAEALSKQALPEIEKAEGPDGLYVSNTLNRLGLAQAGNGELVAATRSLNRALLIREAVLPPGHPWIAISQRNLYWVLKQRLSGPVPKQGPGLLRQQRSSVG